MIISKKLLRSNAETSRYIPDNKKMTLDAETNHGSRWIK